MTEATREREAALEELTDLAARAAELSAAIAAVATAQARAVARARRTEPRATWRQIGAALGVSHQAAIERFGNVRTDATSEHVWREPQLPMTVPPSRARRKQPHQRTTR